MTDSAKDEKRCPASGERVTGDRYPVFDWLRLALALEVAVGHYLILKGRGIPFWPVSPVGAFVAISGFLVLGSYERSKNWLEFAWKRICRVAPAFTVSLCLVALLFGLRALYPALAEWASVGTVSESMNRPLWSLSAEEILYCALALLFTLGAYRKVWPIWVLLGLTASVYWVSIPGSIAYQIAGLPPSFLVGSLAYIYRAHLKRVPWVAISPALIVASWYVPAGWPIIFIQPLAIVGLGAFGPSPRWSLKTDVSYGTYIYHWPLVIAFGLPGLLAAPILALASWKFIEAPALKLKNASLTDVRVLVAASVNRWVEVCANVARNRRARAVDEAA